MNNELSQADSQPVNSREGLGAELQTRIRYFPIHNAQSTQKGRKQESADPCSDQDVDFPKLLGKS